MASFDGPISDGKITIYSWGILSCSVCAPADMESKEIEQRVNRLQPTGIGSLWTIADKDHFRQGGPMPGPCENNDSRKHWLLHC